jgi:hypothetical protein
MDSSPKRGNRIFEWYGGKREWQKAEQLASGDMLNEWHSLHGRR